MKELELNNNIFESIKHVDESEKEYWSARELQKVLDYKEWRKFNGVINKAINVCKTSNVKETVYFVGTDKPIRGDNVNIQIKRLYIRKQTKIGNYSLNQTDKKVGVKNFDKFQIMDIKDYIMVRL